MRIQHQKVANEALNIHVTIWEGKSISLNQEKRAKMERAHDLKDKGASHGSNSRIQSA
jgi:hypothetical protein